MSELKKKKKYVVGVQKSQASPRWDQYKAFVRLQSGKCYNEWLTVKQRHKDAMREISIKSFSSYFFVKVVLHFMTLYFLISLRES